MPIGNMVPNRGNAMTNLWLRHCWSAGTEPVRTTERRPRVLRDDSMAVHTPEIAAGNHRYRRLYIGIDIFDADERPMSPTEEQLCAAILEHRGKR